MTENDQQSNSEARKASEAEAAAGTKLADTVELAAKVDVAAAVAAKKAAEPVHPATTRQKVWTALALILTTILFVWIAKSAVTKVDGYIQKENRVTWQAPAGFTLKPGPPTFWYDAGKSELVHIGVIEPKVKLELIGLVPLPAEQSPPVETKSPAATSPPAAEVQSSPSPVKSFPYVEMKSYWAALDQLAFLSNQQMGGMLISLLLLGGVAGVLGAQLRSLGSFIGHACYTNRLDMVIWWPYFLLRPFTGFLLGIVVVIVVQAGLLAAGSGTPSSTMWWASIAFLAGFGDTEFTERLRQLTKTLFGASK